MRSTPRRALARRGMLDFAMIDCRHIPAMTPLDAHAYALHEAIGRAFVHSDPWIQVSDWLHLAAGLAAVKYDSRHDDGPIYCESIGDWNDRRDSVRSAYLLHATRLLYVCCAVEAAVRQLLGTNAARRHGGIVRAVAAALSTAVLDEPKGYEELVWHITVTGRSDAEFRSRIRAAASVSFRAAGAFLAFEIRNRLAHGTARLPDADDDEHGELARQVQLADFSARVLLLTLQMLFIAHVDAANVEMEDAYATRSDGAELLSHRSWFAQLHLPRAPRGPPPDRERTGKQAV